MDAPREGPARSLRTSSALAPVFEQQRALNEAVRLRPMDEGAWLALAEFEETAVDVRAGSNRKRGAVAERKVTVLRRAVLQNRHSESLRAALLRACEGLLDADELAKEWDDALQQIPGSIALWSQLLSLKART